MPFLGNDSESDRQQININKNNNNISNSSVTKEKSQIKKNENNNEINIVNNKDSPILNLDEDKVIKYNQKYNIDDNNKKLLEKKRRPRIHLEDLDIDTEIIKEKKNLIVGDKVILSKNQIITEEDKKEIRAIRNRKSAKKSRDRKKIEYINLIQKIELN